MKCSREPRDSLTKEKTQRWSHALLWVTQNCGRIPCTMADPPSSSSLTPPTNRGRQFYPSSSPLTPSDPTATDPGPQWGGKRASLPLLNCLPTLLIFYLLFFPSQCLAHSQRDSTIYTGKSVNAYSLQRGSLLAWTEDLCGLENMYYNSHQNINIRYSTSSCQMRLMNYQGWAKGGQTSKEILNFPELWPE